MTGIEPNAIAGIVAFSGLAALGAWKEVHGVDFWTRGRLSFTVFLSLLCDIAHTVLAGLSLKIWHDQNKCEPQSDLREPAVC